MSLRLLFAPTDDVRIEKADPMAERWLEDGGVNFDDTGGRIGKRWCAYVSLAPPYLEGFLSTAFS